MNQPKSMPILILAMLATLPLLASCQEASGPAEQTVDATAPAQVQAGEIQKAETPGIVNYSQLDESGGYAGSLVGFGGATQPSAMALLEERGFASVISLRMDSEKGVEIDASRKAAESAGLNYIHLPFSPRDAAPGIVDEFLAAAGNPANQPVYIHCASATRVGAMWIIGRVLEDGWTLAAASEEAQAIASNPEQSITFATMYLASLRQ